MRASVKFGVDLIACMVIGPIVVVVWAITGVVLTACAVCEYIRSVIADALADRRARIVARRWARRYDGPDYRLPPTWRAPR